MAQAKFLLTDGKLVAPSFVDLHVHFREPGQSYKETIRTGSMAAAHGGYGIVCAMPNLDPVPDSLETLALEQEIIDRDAARDWNSLISMHSRIAASPSPTTGAACRTRT